VLGASPLTPAEITSKITSSTSPYQTYMAGSGPSGVPNGVAFMLAQNSFTLAKSETYSQYNIALAASSGPGETVTFSLDPGFANGNFVNLASDIRILYWREVPLQ
ncbi:MAG: hypothetical protein U0931_41850, partial [Vulcanimicrobiota bacterium]